MSLYYCKSSGQEKKRFRQIWGIYTVHTIYNLLNVVVYAERKQSGGYLHDVVTTKYTTGRRLIQMKCIWGWFRLLVSFWTVVSGGIYYQQQSLNVVALVKTFPSKSWDLALSRSLVSSSLLGSSSCCSCCWMRYIIIIEEIWSTEWWRWGDDIKFSDGEGLKRWQVARSEGFISAGCWSCRFSF